MVKAHHRRKRDEGVYFREMYTLQYNQWQAEHAKNPEFLEPTEVLRMPTDELPKVSKPSRQPTNGGWTQEEIERATARVNAHSQREVNLTKQRRAELVAQNDVVKAEQATALAQGLTPRPTQTVMVGNMMLDIYEENPPMGPLTREEVGGQVVEEPLLPKEQTHENNF